MKWPEQLVLVRHAESSYNLKKRERNDSQVYQEFKESFRSDWQSAKTKKLAIEVAKILSKDNGEDYTALTEEGRDLAVGLGKKLSKQIYLPDVVYVSPYLRTTETWKYMVKGWPELSSVRTIIEERIREQDFGLRLLYGDWRVMQVFHPEQRPLYNLQGQYWYRQPQGENIPDVRARLRSWMSTLTRDYGGQKVLAITHHIAILAFRANIERLHAAEFNEMYRKIMPENCSISEYGNQTDDQGNDWLELKYFNKTL